MDNIEYIEEEREEVVARVEIPVEFLDMSEEERRENIYGMLSNDNYDLGDISNLVFEYDGIENLEHGLSGIATVSKIVKEKVPYRVTKEEVFSCTLDYMPVNVTELEARVMEMMKLAGILTDDNADYELYVDENGNQPNAIAVYKVNKVKIFEDVVVNEKAGLDTIVYEEEVVLNKIFSGSFINDKNLSEQDKNAKVYQLMRTASVNTSFDDLEIQYIDSLNDGVIGFTVFDKVRKLVPYSITEEKVFSGSYLPVEGISSHEERERLFDMMRAEGIPVLDKDELEIRYDEAVDGEEVHFDIYRVKKVPFVENAFKNDETDIEKNKVLEDILKPEDIEVDEVEMEEIATGRVEVEGLNSQKEIDDKVLSILKVTGVDISNLGELKFSYGEEVVDGKKDFSVSKVKVSKVKYHIDKKYIGDGIIHAGEDVYAVIQRNHGLDIRNNSLYEVVFGKDNSSEREYTLIKNTRTRLDTKNVDKIDESENQITGSANIDVLSSDEDIQEQLKKISDKFSNRQKRLADANRKYDELFHKVLELDKMISQDLEHRDNYIQQRNELSRELSLAYKEVSHEENKIAKLVKKHNKLLGTLDSYIATNPLSNIEALYDSLLNSANFVGGRNGKFSNTQLGNVINKSALLPERIVNNGSRVIDYVPGKAPDDVNANFGAMDSSKDTLEKFVIYETGQDNNKVLYANKYLFDRFNIQRLGDAVKIENKTCFKIPLEDVSRIRANSNNEYSPYEVEFREADIKTLENNSLGKDEDGSSIKEEKITLYRDLNDDLEVYASRDVLKKFGVKPSNNGRMIEGKVYQKVSHDAVDMIEHLAKESVNPKYILDYHDIKLKKEQVAHVESILNKLTKDLDIRRKDYKRFVASNIKVADNFRKELHSGNVLYNIVHIVPSIGKAAISLLKKIGGKILSSKRSRAVVTEMQRRLDEEITDSELDVLFNEYKGSQLKTDMNIQINGVILEKLRSYGLSKVEKLNGCIKNSYSQLFVLLGEIKVIDNQLAGQLNSTEAQALNDKRKDIMTQASNCGKEILKYRKDANNLLSSGVHGITEDFKAVESKLSYVGMRFAKNNNFDNKLQEKLGKYGEGLSEALSNGEDEEIVNNFVGLESCYYKNTEIAHSLFGNRSVGSKYYSPLAEEFDYRDDPFIRDMFTTIALTSAAYSAVNSYRIHKIEAEKELYRQQREFQNVNDTNDGIMEYVRQTGSNIEGKGEVFKEGMEAQIHQDVLNTATTVEHATLDYSGWRLNDFYREADRAGYEFFSHFHENVSLQLNDLTSKYASGVMSQAEVLNGMSDIARGTQGVLNNVVSETIGVLEGYASTHPQFNFDAISQSLEYISAHPDAINNMNQAMVDVANMGCALQGLSAAHAEALASLPSDMLSTVVAAASASGLALNVSRKMHLNYVKKNGYGNEIIDMMDEYLNEAMEEDSKSSRR